MEWGILVPIVAIIFGTTAGMFRRWLKLKERQMEITSRDTAETAAQYAAKTERLEQRVAVLEQIVTDGGIETANQIEALRAPRLTGGGKIQ